MTTIYVITEGSYSDYHIVGVYDDKELAEQFVKSAIDKERYSEMQVEEYELNKYADKIKQGLLLFSVTMDHNGEGYSYLIHDEDEMPLKLNDWNPKKLYGNIWARSKEHSLKIANEKRAQLIALNQW